MAVAKSGFNLSLKDFFSRFERVQKPSRRWNGEDWSKESRFEN